MTRQLPLFAPLLNCATELSLTEGETSLTQDVLSQFFQKPDALLC